jgi:hypothetical protein
MKEKRALSGLPVGKACCDSGIHYFTSGDSGRLTVFVISILKWRNGIPLTVDNLSDAPFKATPAKYGVTPNVSFYRALNDVEAVQAKKRSSFPIPKGIRNELVVSR